jgi:4-amino-4-deoxy-L-arabinose transferase-like glycosyltransferase
VQLRDPQVRATCALVCLFLLLFALRAVYLTADPPVDLDWSGGLFFDEGMLVHGARNKVLFGTWNLDEWNDFYISPLLAYVKWGVFAALGVGIGQGRLIPLAFSMLTLLFFYLAMKESFGRRTAVLAVALLGLDYVFIMFNRLGLSETALVFVMVLTAYLWQRGHRVTGGRGAFLLCGASSALAHIVKSVFYFLPVPIVASLLAARGVPTGDGARESRGRGPGPAAWCLLGMAIPIAAWYALVYRRHAASIDQAMAFYQFLAVPASVEQLLINVTPSPLFESFARAPVVLLLAALGIGPVVYVFFHHRHALRPLDLFMLCWFVSHFAMYTVSNYRPVRHYVPVIPPMCALAARVLIGWSSTAAVRLPRRISGAAAALLVVWLTWLLAYGVFPLARRYGRAFPVTLPEPSWDRRMLASAAVAVLLVATAALLARRWGGGSLAVPARLRAAGFYGLLVAIVAANGYLYYRWAAEPRYVIRDVSRELGRTLNNALIAGLGAPMIVLENTHRALHAFPRFFNHPGTLDRYPVTHLFVGAYNQESDFYFRDFPDQMRRATPVKIYPIKESHFYLYSLVEPTVEGIRVSKESYRPGEHVTVTLAVKNRESASSREVTPGWMLQPVGAASGDVVVAAAPAIRLPPGQTGEVTLPAGAGPGTYRLMAFAAPPYQNVLEAELLTHRLGEPEADPDASNGQAWKVRGADPNRGQAVFGPYLRYPAGHLKATFRMRTADAAAEHPVARIEITTGGGRKVLARRELRGGDFKAAAYEEFELSSFLGELQALEFRVGSYKRADLWIDRIQVEFVPGEWYERPITVEAPRL